VENSREELKNQGAFFVRRGGGAVQPDPALRAKVGRVFQSGRPLEVRRLCQRVNDYQIQHQNAPDISKLVKVTRTRCYDMSGGRNVQVGDSHTICYKPENILEQLGDREMTDSWLQITGA